MRSIRWCVILLLVLPLQSLLPADAGDALRKAAEKGDNSHIADLLGQGVNVDAANSKQRTALILASAYGKTETVKLLLERGAKVNYEDLDGFTALRAAAVEGYADTVAALLDAGADPNTIHQRGVTALMAAASSGKTDIVKLLVARGADLKLRTPEGVDALCMATQQRKKLQLKHPDTVTALLEAGADRNTSDCFLDPEYKVKAPGTIAVFRVTDARPQKGSSAKLMEQLEHSLVAGLQWRRYHGYTVTGLQASRQRLLATGTSAEQVDTVNPSVACTALGVDAVFEATLQDFAKSQLVIAQGSAMNLVLRLTSCKSGELLWSFSDTIAEMRGFLMARFISSTRMLTEMALETLPRRP